MNKTFEEKNENFWKSNNHVDEEGKPEYITVLNYAIMCHQEQVRKTTGIPMITHCIKVADNIRKDLQDTEIDFVPVVLSGLLHDAVEDTELTLENIEH